MPLPFIIAGLGAIGSAIGGAAATAGAIATGAAATVGAGAAAVGTAAAGAAATIGAGATAAGAFVSANAVPLAAVGGSAFAIGHGIGKEEGYHEGEKAGYNTASSEYEQKLKEQAERFRKEKGKLLAEARASSSKKNQLIQDCIDAIRELESENEYLKRQNQRLSSEKQELLNFYRSMKSQFSAA